MGKEGDMELEMMETVRDGKGTDGEGKKGEGNRIGGVCVIGCRGR